MVLAIVVASLDVCPLPGVEMAMFGVDILEPLAEVLGSATDAVAVVEVEIVVAGLVLYILRLRLA